MEMSELRRPSRGRKILAVAALAVILLVLLSVISSTRPGTGPADGGSGATEIANPLLPLLNFTLPTTPTTPQPQTNVFGGSQVGSSSIQGLQQALSGQSGLNAFLSARECGLVIQQTILFCDSFPDYVLDGRKWVSFGTITVTPGNVVFQNATMRTVRGFQYGKFATFLANIIWPPPTVCQRGYVLRNGVCVWDYAVWGFGVIEAGTNVLYGIFWEQNGTQIRSHTRYKDILRAQTVEQVSQWRPMPLGIVDFGINWNLDLSKGGAYAQFVYRLQNSNTLIYFSLHTGPSIPATFLYLFAAANGTHFTLHRVVIMAAWVGGQIPFVGLMARLGFREWF